MADDKEISAAFPFESKYIDVEGSKIHYVEEGTGDPDFQFSGGNPGGHLTADDDVQGGVWYWQAPQKYHGNFAGAYGKTLTFDLKQSGTNDQFDSVDVILSGGGIILTLDSLSNPGTSWTGYTVTLDESAGWSNGGAAATRADVEAVLSSLDDLQIRGEYINGPDTGGLDNVVLNVE